MAPAVPFCFNWFMHVMALALLRAEFKAGSSMPAKIAMMAITTRSSINVNCSRWRFEHEMDAGGFAMVMICIPFIYDGLTPLLHSAAESH